jgi:L-alanine-DL-glutamate epimerase-like enolase superfamily enzyme
VTAAHVCAAMSLNLAIEFHADDVPWWGELVEGVRPVTQGSIQLIERPGHGLTLNEDVARAHLEPGSSFFGDLPHA